MGNSCGKNVVCFDVALVIVLILLVGIGFFYFWMYNTTKSMTPIDRQIGRTRYMRRDPNGTETEVVEENPINVLLEGDVRRAFDPLIEPIRRPPLDQIPDPQFSMMTNIRTRPFYDSPSLFGVLSKETENAPRLNRGAFKAGEDYRGQSSSADIKDGKDKIDGIKPGVSSLHENLLQLYGYRDDVNNYRYNYYAVTKDGIKLDVDTQRNVLELNTGDRVFVLNTPYIVRLYSDKFYKYNPYSY